MDLIAEIKTVLRAERDAINTILEKDHRQPAAAVELIHNCSGRVILTGIGKAGLVGRKIAATLCSIGTPSIFLHPTEALHGDLGFITDGDIVIILSYSGNTDEIKRLIPLLNYLGTKIIAITGNLESDLARQSYIVIDTAVKREADPLNTIPTSSTTAMLAMGDALAVALAIKRNITAEQLSIFHPGGILGNKLMLKVEKLMHSGANIPSVRENATVRDAICEMSCKHLGATFIIKNNGFLAGVFTDGDLRRLLEKESDPLNKLISEVMTRKPVTIKADVLAIEAIKLMEMNMITILPVVDINMHLKGVIQLHDLVSAGLK